jgi:hypothetical protein
LHRALIVPKTLFIVPTDAHYYKIIEMLKQFKTVIQYLLQHVSVHAGTTIGEQSCAQLKLQNGFSLLIGMDAVIVMAAYHQPR